MRRQGTDLWSKPPSEFCVCESWTETIPEVSEIVNINVRGYRAGDPIRFKGILLGSFSDDCENLQVTLVGHRIKSVCFPCWEVRFKAGPMNITFKCGDVVRIPPPVIGPPPEFSDEGDRGRDDSFNPGPGKSSDGGAAEPGFDNEDKIAAGVTAGGSLARWRGFGGRVFVAETKMNAPAAMTGNSGTKEDGDLSEVEPYFSDPMAALAALSAAAGKPVLLQPVPVTGDNQGATGKYGSGQAWLYDALTGARILVYQPIDATTMWDAATPSNTISGVIGEPNPKHAPTPTVSGDSADLSVVRPYRGGHDPDASDPYHGDERPEAPSPDGIVQIPEM